MLLSQKTVIESCSKDCHHKTFFQQVHAGCLRQCSPLKNKDHVSSETTVEDHRFPRAMNRNTLWHLFCKSRVINHMVLPRQVGNSQRPSCHLS